MTAYTLWNSASTTATTRVESAINIGCEFKITQSIWVTALRFRRPDTTSQTVRIGIMQHAIGGGPGLITISPQTMTLGSTAGWKDYTFPAPVKLKAFGGNSWYDNYRIIVNCTRWCETLNYFSTGAGSTSRTVGGAVLVPSKASAISTQQNSFMFSTTWDWPNAVDANGPNWWVDMVFHDVDPRIPRRSGSFITMGSD